MYGFTIAVDVVLFIFARPLAGIFNLSPEALDASEEVLRWYAVAAAIFWPASFTVPNALRAAGDARFTMGVSVLCMWVFRIGASYLLVYSFDMGLLGIWVAMFIDWVVRGAFFVTRYLGSRWLTKRVCERLAVAPPEFGGLNADELAKDAREVVGVAEAHAQRDGEHGVVRLQQVALGRSTRSLLT